MSFISEYVEIDEFEKKVKFFGDEQWYKVDDIEAFVECFYDRCRDIASEINACSSIIEKSAFYDSL